MVDVFMAVYEGRKHDKRKCGKVMRDLNEADLNWNGGILIPIVGLPLALRAKKASVFLLVFNLKENSRWRLIISDHRSDT
eukprot:scaffold10678_cov62-Skeletonema_menzelii.AAC.2